MKKWLLLVLVAVALVAAGCGTQPVSQPAPPEPEPLDIAALVGQWAESRHSNVLMYPATRDGCVLCHDGGAFAGGLTEQAQLGRDFYISVDCRACHTGRALEIMEAGVVDLPTQEGFKAGLGALCLSCHNERRAPDVTDARRGAPHASSQGGVLPGTGGLRAEGFEYTESSVHTRLDNTCVACHMPVTEAGFMSHSFQVDVSACVSCHSGITEVNITASGDFDGDGQVKGFQDEIKGLLDLLEAKILEVSGAASFTTGGGRIQFLDANGQEFEPMEISDEVYFAAYNHVLVKYDGSYGIHNPTFTVQLLQQSYRVLAGEDVPGATIK